VTVILGEKGIKNIIDFDMHMLLIYKNFFIWLVEAPV